MKLATLCYIRDKDKILMIHRTKQVKDLFKDYWNGLGGKLKENESPEECVIRELKEESGLTIKHPQLKGIITLPNNRDSQETWYLFVYLVTEFNGDLIENEEGRLEWIPIKDLFNLNLQEADKHFIQWLDRKEFFSAKFHYNGDSLLDYQVNFY